MPTTTERTSFTKDIQGRFLCNNLAEVDAWKSAGGRPFDFIIVGGGTFGSAIAEHLWFRQKQAGGGLRTLVVEAGLLTVPEHVQNTGIQGFTDPQNPFFLNENAPQPEKPQNEVWGIPWKSAIPFKGLAYTLGGRSLFWGGWSPRLLNEEMATWPATTVADLNGRYFDESSRQIGVDEANDFISGELQNGLRRQLFDNLAGVADVFSLDALPPSPLLKPGSDPAQLLGLTSTAGLSQADLLNLLKLEAPLAVQARPPHAGFFPLNKFSVVPLLTKAARTAASDSNGNDTAKEFMILPDVHVLSLRTVPTAAGTWRVTGIDTSQGPIDLAPSGTVVIALGTIENARLALASFEGSGLPTLPLIGKNLIAHLRSNLVIRVPRAAISGLSAAANELQTAALFVKGRATRQNGDLIGRFHLQISASGGGNSVGAEDELFRKVPDVDFYDQLRTSTDTHVAIAIRGLGEMEPADPANAGAHPSRVELSTRTDEYGVRRASVLLTQTPRDQELWNAMDAAMQKVADIFANGQPMQVIQNNRDGLGTTHHEAGTLWMGTDPTKSVTDGDGRFHHTENLYAAGPALFPEHRLTEPDAHGYRTVPSDRRPHHGAPTIRRCCGFRKLIRRHLARRLDDVDDQQPTWARRPRLLSGSTGCVGGTGRDGSRPSLAYAADARPLCIAAAMDDDGTRRQFGSIYRLPGSEARRLRQHRLRRRQLRLRDTDRPVGPTRQCADPQNRCHLLLQGPDGRSADRASGGRME